jgi:2'-5' RNA ligase
VKSFSVHLNTINLFEREDFSVVYLDPDNSAVSKIVEIIQKLYDVLIPYGRAVYDKKNLVPHLTIARRMPLAKVKEIQKELGSEIDFNFTVSELVIFQSLEGKWNIVKKIPLTNS